MKCDYIALESLNSDLQIDFNNLISILDSIENSFDKVCNIYTWDSPTSNFYLEKVNEIKNNIDIFYNKQKNVYEYLEMVANNYRNAENDVKKAMDSF